jgi:hypothetical protein
MEKSFRGLIDKDGHLKIFDMRHFKAFLGEQTGKGVIISLKIEDPKASVFSKSYFVSVVCAEFVKIFRKEYGEFGNTETISERLRSWFPPCRTSDGIRELDDLSQDEMTGLIAHSKYIAANEFDYQIPD